MKCVSVALALLVLVALEGCGNTVGRVESVLDVETARTEGLRKWVRQDRERKGLLIFVHGFNATIESAWRSFPDLVAADPRFSAFNILLFGYPTKLCRQVADIARSGELLSSYLKAVGFDYDALILVGHSLGGLVILNGLITLEQDAPTLFQRATMRVLTFGTPHAGVPGARILSLLCENPQAAEMTAFNDALSRLHKTWQGKFGEGTGRGKEARLVPVSPYFGHNDEFVPRGSACAGFERYCEGVDGNHVTMVKPDAAARDPRDHLAYRKLLHAIDVGSPIRPTAPDTIGIWVARFRGDDKEKDFPAQRDTIADLQAAVRREDDLKALVEIRDLGHEVRGSTDSELEEVVQRLGAERNASVVVWGEITGVVGNEVFRPRVTAMKSDAVETPTVLLDPVTKAIRERELDQLSHPPDTVRLPPERIREPLRLARFIVALSYYRQGKWKEASQRLEQLIAGGLASSLAAPDVDMYAGLANYYHHLTSGDAESLRGALGAFTRALAPYRAQQSWSSYASAQNNLGLTYRTLAERGVEPVQNLERSVQALEDAARLRKEQQNWASYATARNNLGLTYRELAERGVEPARHLTTSVQALEDAVRFWKEQGNWASYALGQNNLGITYRALAEHGVGPVQNLELAATALEQATQLLQEHGNWRTFASVRNNLGLTYLGLAEHGVEPVQNLERSVQALEDAARLGKEQQNWATYALVRNNVGLTLRALAERGVEPAQNLERSAQALEDAAHFAQEQGNWAGYALAQNNLGVTYRLLAEHGVEPPQNLERSVMVLTDASRLWKEQQNWASYALAQNNLAATYHTLAERGVEPVQNLTASASALEDAARLVKEQQNWASYARAQNNLGVTYQTLGRLGVEPRQHLERSAIVLAEAARLWKEQGNWASYALAQHNFGFTCRLLAEFGVEPSQNLERSVTASTDAARLWKEQGNWASSGLTQEHLGLTYQALAEEDSRRRENLQLAQTAYEEALRASILAQDGVRKRRVIDRLKAVLRALMAEPGAAEAYRARLEQLDAER